MIDLYTPIQSVDDDDDQFKIGERATHFASRSHIRNAHTPMDGEKKNHNNKI